MSLRVESVSKKYHQKKALDILLKKKRFMGS